MDSMLHMWKEEEMKLKCEKHMRRVMVLTGFKVIHRNDGSHCSTKEVEIGDMLITAEDVDRARTVMNNIDLDFADYIERDC